MRELTPATGTLVGPASVLATHLAAAVVLFGGAYFWAAAGLAAGLGALALWVRPRLAPEGWLRVVDLSLIAVLVAILVQLIPLPIGLLTYVSPARVAYQQSLALDHAAPGPLPLTLDRIATVHALLAALCTFVTFWIARTLFARHAIRVVVVALAWIAVALVLVAVAQSAAGTSLVYGFWQPYGAGARPLGPFVNRNHAGTWSVLAAMLCCGCFQWRRTAPSRARRLTWRSRMAAFVDGRSVVLGLAVVLLTLLVAIGASRSTMLALACAAGYVAWAARGSDAPRDARQWLLGLGALAAVAFLAYADVETLVSRLDQTWRVGFSTRRAIWRDTIGVIQDFPAAGVGAGNFSNAMRLYQTSDRTYFWNEAHNEYLQVAAEGGALIGLPAALAMSAFAVAAVRRLRRRDDPLRWMRIGAAAALLAAAVQAIWETGLTLPANGMLAGVAAAILVHESPSSSHAAPRH